MFPVLLSEYLYLLMLSDAQLLTVQVASSREPTPELASFWSAKYRELYLQKVFFLDQATEELVAREIPVKEYVEPRGYVNLGEHIVGGRLDEEKLTRTVAVATRYLDDLIDTLEFSERAQKVAENYRAIKLSVQGLERYLDQVRPLSEHAEIQKVAEHLARAAYRASESLAEEKGTCTSWQKYRKPPRIKVFDLLYNEETDEVEDALRVGLETNLEASPWEVYQRRNLTLLDLPKNTSWEGWDDYAEPKIVESTSAKPRVPTRAVEVNVNGDKIATMAEALNSSPYKKLFSSLLNEEGVSPDPTVSSPPPATTETPQTSPTPSPEPSSGSAKSEPVSNAPVVHIVFRRGQRAQLVTHRGEIVQEAVARYCRYVEAVRLLHAATLAGQVHLVYVTSVENSLLRLEAELQPLAALSLPGIDLPALLLSSPAPKEYPVSVQAQTKNPQVPSAPLQTSSQPARPSTSTAPAIRPASPLSNKPRRAVSKLTPPRQDTYQLNTKYFGRVELIVYSQGSRIQKVEGTLRYHGELTTAVFGILQDLLLVMQQDYVPLEEMQANLRRKIYGEINPQRQKVLTLIQLLLGLICR